MVIDSDFVKFVLGCSRRLMYIGRQLSATDIARKEALYVVRCLYC